MTARQGENAIHRDGFDLHYRVSGAGSPVVLISGGPGLDCDYLQPVAEQIAKTHLAILVELRGTGRSMPAEINAATVNAPLILADLEAIREAIGAEEWTIAGHSAGAVLAMNYAAAFWEKISSLLLINSGPMRYASGAAQRDNVWMRLTTEERESLSKLGRQDFGKMFQIMLPGYVYDRASVPIIAARVGPENVHAPTAALLAAEILGPQTDLRPALQDFSKPVLIVAGRQDPVDAVVQMEIHQTLKNSTLRFLDRCGHLAWFEQPDAFYKVLREFLAA